jgi:membrane fusion protein (multidrug efflux system)
VNRTPSRPHPVGFLLVPALLAALLLGASGCSKKSDAPPPPPPEVLVAEVVQRDVPIVQEFVGEAAGDPDVEIRSRVSGFVEAIRFTEGTQVKQGQLLYLIDPRELEERLSQARAQVAAAKTRLAYAVSDVARYKPLAEINAVSKRDLDAAVAKEESARAEVQAAEATESIARLDLSYARVTAPISGLIGISRAKVGDYVEPMGQTALLNTISRLDPIRVRFSITEAEFLGFVRRRAIEKAEEVQSQAIPLDLILADGSLHSEKGSVDVANREVDAGTGTLRLEAVFPNPKGWVRPGQYAKIRAVTDTLKGALLVPQRAVREIQGQYQVFVVGTDETVSIRSVVPGPRLGELWVMTEGLKPGERVIVEGVQKVRGGVKVAAKPAGAGDAPAPAAGN